MEFKSKKEINHYLISELYHQILLRITPSLMPMIKTRKFIGGQVELFHSGIDYIDNIIIYDESMLYDKDNKDKYAVNYQRYRRIYHKRDLVVYHDTETNFFVISPRVSKVTLFTLARFNKNQSCPITIDNYRRIGQDFYNYVLDALYRIGEVYIRDMAVAEIEPFYCTEEKFRSKVNTSIDSFAELIDIYHTISTINTLCLLPKEEVCMTKQLWREERYMTQKVISVVYNRFCSMNPEIILKGILIDPLIRFDVIPTNMDFNDNPVECYTSKISIPNQDDVVYILSFIWETIISKLNTSQFYTAEFNLIDIAIDLIVNHLMIQFTDEDKYIHFVNKCIERLKDEDDSLIKERAVFRLANYEVDDMPHLYDINKYVGSISKKGHWTK